MNVRTCRQKTHVASPISCHATRQAKMQQCDMVKCSFAGQVTFKEVKIKLAFKGFKTWIINTKAKKYAINRETSMNE